MKLSELKNRVTEITVPLPANERFDIGVYMGRITQNFLDDIYRAQTKLRATANGETPASNGGDPEDLQLQDEITSKWCQRIDWWDITDDDGNQLPVTVEVAKDLPFYVFGSIFDAVLSKASDVEEEGKDSDGS